MKSIALLLTLLLMGSLAHAGEANGGRIIIQRPGSGHIHNPLNTLVITLPDGRQLVIRR